eukprot:TRINITY_DN33375_c0_g1_i1.p1 TRINITY_DN33375_c0_g1~~TRINITY_DN33375_c0_g1_i1.p1  ORF type:complete len:188 (+),score=29.65 TRINITY_DN33375_c0_g1_i1:328-891(+)
MGQASTKAVASKATQIERRAAQIASKPPQPSPPVIPAAQDFPPRPPPPQLQPIVEPSDKWADEERGDPKYASLMQQIVGNITDRPMPTTGSNEEMEAAAGRPRLRSDHSARPLPAERHTGAASGMPDESTATLPGRCNLKTLGELTRLHAAGADAKELAETYGVDPLLLAKVLGSISGPIERRQEEP